jgi:hypothetical protein
MGCIGLHMAKNVQARLPTRSNPELNDRRLLSSSYYIHRLALPPFLAKLLFDSLIALSRLL